MALKTFAAIEVGSNELELKIYEISKKIGIRQIDHVRYIIELGSDAYTEGMISYPLVNELCDVLKKFRFKMDEYKVEKYVAYGGSALMEASNGDLILDQIRLKTGLEVKLISNAQQRFLIFKSLAFTMPNFETLINEGVVVIDLGAGSIQLSAFEDGVLQFTQNVKLGSLRIREMLSDMEGQTSDFINLMKEYVDNGMYSYRVKQLSQMKIKHAVVVGGEFTPIIHLRNNAKNDGYIRLKDFEESYTKLVQLRPGQIQDALGISYEEASVLVPAAIVIKAFLSQLTVDKIWPATADICDGMALDYSQKVERFLLEHDFSKDIIKSARYIAKKYESDERHVKNIENNAKTLFDATKKISGLNNRHRMLLQLAVVLHDTGKFINGSRSVYNSSHIIRETELIGISEAEREIVANVVLYSSSQFVPRYEDMSHEIDRAAYIDMLKLTALFSLANGMDKSHKQKIDTIRVAITEQEMKIIADTIYDITLEQSAVDEKADFFEEIFGIRPVLRQKRSI